MTKKLLLTLTLISPLMAVSANDVKAMGDTCLTLCQLDAANESLVCIREFEANLQKNSGTGDLSPTKIYEECNKKWETKKEACNKKCLAPGR